MERSWTDFEPQEYSLSDHSVPKKLFNLLRRGCVLREDGGAIEFWRTKDDLQKHFVFCNHIRALQGHSGRNHVDPSLQDTVLILTISSSTFVTLDMQSIYICSSIQGWYREVKIWAIDSQYSFCLWIQWTRTIRILMRSSWMHCVMHKTCMNYDWFIRTQYIGSTSILLWRKDGISFILDRTLFFTKHFQLIVFESCSDGNWRSHLREGLCVTSSSSKDFFETWLDERLLFRTCTTIRSWAII